MLCVASKKKMLKTKSGSDVYKRRAGSFRQGCECWVDALSCGIHNVNTFCSSTSSYAHLCASNMANSHWSCCSRLPHPALLGPPCKSPEYSAAGSFPRCGASGVGSVVVKREVRRSRLAAAHRKRCRRRCKPGRCRSLRSSFAPGGRCWLGTCRRPQRS